MPAHSTIWTPPSRHYWVLPKRPWQPISQRGAILAGVVFVPLFGVLGATLNPLALPGPSFLVLYGVLFLNALLLSLVFRRTLRQQDDGEDVRVTPNEAACLAHSDTAPIVTTVCRLIQGGSLEIAPARTRRDSYCLKAKQGLPKDADSKGARSLASVIHKEASSKDGADLAKMIPILFGYSWEIRSKLEEQGLLESHASFVAPRWSIRMLFGGLMLLGVIKLFLGLAGGWPVGYLVAMLVATGLTLVVLTVPPRRTLKGNRVLQKYQNDYKHLQASDAQRNLTPDQVAMTVALFGLGVFSAGRFDLIELEWKRSIWALRLHRANSCFTNWGSGCGAGCGGGSGGGGSGGCGGCGGG